MKKNNKPNLWCPWRISFLSDPREPGCIFCKFPASAKKNDKENLILYRGKKNFIILNKYPYTNGHLMVVPYQHTNQLTDLSVAEHSEMMKLTTVCAELLKKSLRAQGINIGMNLGEAAGAGIRDHLHMHIVPRWLGDTNFMPMLSGERVMVEYLHETYDRLQAALKK